MKVGIIGFGKMGMLHAALLNQMDNVELTSISEKSGFIRAAAKAIIPYLRYYKDHNTMIRKEHLDAVVVCTPTFTHMDIAQAAIRNGVDVFIEKPLSNNLRSALDFQTELISRDRVCMVGYCMRYAPTFRKAGQLLKQGIIGKVNEVYGCAYIADVFRAEKGWRYNPQASGGGVIIDFSVHILDLLHWYFGDVTTLSATTKKLYSSEVEDEASISLNFADGCQANVETSWSKEDCRKAFYMIEITGDRGFLKVTDQTIHIKTKEREEEIYYPDVYEGYFVDIAGGQYSHQITDFIDLCRTREKQENSIDSAVHIQAIVDAIYSSAQCNETVKVKG